jgi:hypothetical protein
MPKREKERALRFFPYDTNQIDDDAIKMSHPFIVGWRLKLTRESN